MTGAEERLDKIKPVAVEEGEKAIGLAREVVAGCERYLSDQGFDLQKIDRDHAS